MSGATSRRRGHDWERTVARWLRDRGHAATTARAATGGVQAGADLVTDLPVAIECKAHSRLDLAGWVDQVNATTRGPAAVIVKRRGRPAGDAYVVMAADRWLQLCDRQEADRA